MKRALLVLSGYDNPLIVKDGISRMRSWRAPLAITLYLGLLGAFGYAIFTIQVMTEQYTRAISFQVGGYVFDAYGSYNPVWWLSVFFGVMSALINLPIIEKPLVRTAPVPA